MVGPLILSLVAVTFGAELVVRYASRLGLRLGLSPLFVGLTIVAAGTSMPELVTSIFAATNRQADLVIGNVIGSNLFNVAVILATAALIQPLEARFDRVRGDILLAAAVAGIPWVALATGGILPRSLGALLVGGFVAYTIRAYTEARRTALDDASAVTVPGAGSIPAGQNASIGSSVLGIVAGLCLLVAGARVFVEAAVHLARTFGVSELVIGLTIVAGGTSLPELATSVVAAVRGKSDLALGNVMGSNVFNMLVVLGTSAMVHPQAVAAQVLRLDTPVLLLLQLALIPVAYTGNRISRIEGLGLLISYGLYMGYRVGS